MKRHLNKHNFLSRSVLLEEQGTKGMIRIIIWGTFFIALSFVIWSIYMPLDEVAITKGELVPEMRVQDVQHPVGGVIKRIYVKNGDKVKKGDPLLDLDAEVIKAKLTQSTKMLNTLLARKERLEAYLMHREPNFKKYPDDINEVIKQQTLILQNIIDSEKIKYNLLATQISQAKNELEKLKKQNKDLDEQRELYQKELAIQSKLEKSGAVAKLQVIRLRRNISQLNQKISAMPDDIEKVKSKINELEINRGKIKTDLIAKFRDELETVNQKLPQAKADVIRLKHDYKNLNICANVDGTIYNLTIHTNGAVLKPMTTVMQIVPETHNLVAEVHIQPKDIGYIKDKMLAKVKLTTFDFSRYGAVSGKVKRVSATSYTDRRGAPYYLGIISLDSTSMKIGDELRPLIPGMSVEVDILTGKKSLMKYLLKPIFKSASQALHER
jgi:HlyD family type I secretion membrane fusion protein